MNTSMMKDGGRAAVAAVLLGLAGTAAAGSPLYGHYSNDINTQRVSVSDLNLSHPSGVETLYDRLDQAAKSVCGPREHARELYRYRDWKSCYTEAMDGAVDTVGHRGLTEYHLVQTGRADTDEESQVADR